MLRHRPAAPTAAAKVGVGARQGLHSHPKPRLEPVAMLYSLVGLRVGAASSLPQCVSTCCTLAIASETKLGCCMCVLIFASWVATTTCCSSSPDLYDGFIAVLTVPLLQLQRHATKLTAGFVTCALVTTWCERLKIVQYRHCRSMHDVSLHLEKLAQRLRRQH